MVIIQTGVPFIQDSRGKSDKMTVERHDGSERRSHMEISTLSCVYNTPNCSMTCTFLPSHSVFFLPDMSFLPQLVWQLLLSYLLNLNSNVIIYVKLPLWEVSSTSSSNPVGCHLDFYVFAIYGLSNSVDRMIIVSVFS